MLWNGKIIGIFIGAVLGGPFGALLGLALGHLFDIGFFNFILKYIGLSRSASHAANVQQIFFTSTFTVMGYLAKSDGRVSENEIQTARQIMTRLNLTPSMEREAIDLFNRGKQPDFKIDIMLAQLRRACWRHPSLLKTFTEVQIEMAYADGQHISELKRNALKNICQQLGLNAFTFNHFENRYRTRHNYQQEQQPQWFNPKQHVNTAYKLLEISPSATNEEVKKAYRRQMSKNHPDKLVSKGLPPEMIRLATQKTQQIKDAYETIKKERGIIH